MHSTVVITPTDWKWIGSAIDFARFWSKVDVRGPRECWPWQGASQPSGYGNFGIRVDDRSRTASAPQVAFIIAHGPLPVTNGKAVDVRHDCDNPPCCNPAHLRSGSHADNMRDAMLRRRVPVGTDHYMARLTVDDVRLIRALGHSPARGQQINLARELGVSPSTVNDVLKGRSWKNVTT